MAKLADNKKKNAFVQKPAAAAAAASGASAGAGANESDSDSSDDDWERLKERIPFILNSESS